MRRLLAVISIMLCAAGATKVFASSIGTTICRNSGSIQETAVPDDATGIRLTSVLSGLNSLRISGGTPAETVFEGRPGDGQFISVPTGWDAVVITPDSPAMETSQVLCFRFE